jgi:hypothetical protein
MEIEDRVQELCAAGHVGSARQLCREVVRNRPHVDVSLAGDELVVSAPPFEGRHDVTVRDAVASESDDDAVVRVERGTYRLDGGPDLEFRVHALWDEAESTALPVLLDAVRQRAFTSVHALEYGSGRTRVDYGSAAEQSASGGEETKTDPSSVSSTSGPSVGHPWTGVVQSVRQLIR